MLTAAIQKQHTTVYFLESKIQNPILSFLMWNSVFLKGKNSITGLITDFTMFDCFLILFARKKSHRKKAKVG